MKQHLNTDTNNEVRHWFGWPVEKKTLNDMTLQIITGNCFSKCLHNSNVVNTFMTITEKLVT